MYLKLIFKKEEGLKNKNQGRANEEAWAADKKQKIGWRWRNNDLEEEEGVKKWWKTGG